MKTEGEEQPSGWPTAMQQDDKGEVVNLQGQGDKEEAEEKGGENERERDLGYLVKRSKKNEGKTIKMKKMIGVWDGRLTMRYRF